MIKLWNKYKLSFMNKASTRALSGMSVIALLLLNFVTIYAIGIGILVILFIALITFTFLNAIATLIEWIG